MPAKTIQIARTTQPMSEQHETSTFFYN